MTTTPEAVSLHAVSHPNPHVQQVGFPLDHSYLEHCWTPLVGPSSVLLLRRCAWLWRDGEPAQVSLEDLAGQLGLGKGTGRSSPVWHTLERVTRFRFAAMPAPDEVHVYTEVPPVPARQVERLPSWCRVEHDRLLGQHLDGLTRSFEAPTARPPSTAPDLRMADRLARTTTTIPSAHAISR